MISLLLQLSFGCASAPDPPTTAPVAQDFDGDGFAADEDCDDTDAAVNPGQKEICRDGVDDDCDGTPGDCVPGDLVLADAEARLEGETDGDWAGEQATGAGDVDGDGLADILVGVWNNHAKGAHAGAAYLVLGSAERGTRSLGAADGRWLGGTDEDQAGRSVAGAGDVDGDGVPDLLVGVPGDDAAGADAGAIWLIRGANALAGLPLEAAGLAYTGAAPGNGAGAHGLAGAGDVDGDGLDDFVVGVEGYDAGAGELSGAGFLVLGGAPAGGSLADADAIYTAVLAYTQAGHKAAGGGDFDGDGHADLIVASPHGGDGGINSGAVWLIRGTSAPASAPLTEADAEFIGDADSHAGSSVAYAGDVDADGFDDVIVGAHNTGRTGESAGAAYLIHGTATPMSLLVASGDAYYGEADFDVAGDVVAGAGDVDADGLADFLVAAPRSDRGGVDAGTAYLVLGSSPRGAMSLADADALYTGTTSELAGQAVAGAGDVDGDGFVDLLVGAPAQADLVSRKGSIYVVFGTGE